MRVLIADDDPITRMTVAALLRKLGHEVLEAEDGVEALALYRKENVRLLILDWMMPRLDGVEVCIKIRAEERASYTYIMMLTSLTARHHYLEAMNAGIDDFLTKPTDGPELTVRLKVAERILSLQAGVKTLERMLPICSYCKQIRDDNDNWHDLSQYVAKKTDTDFSHGICPDCFEREIDPALAKLERVER